MDKIILYHGSPNEVISPIYGGGNDKHDYGRGFYLTDNPELAKEWAVCRPNDKRLESKCILFLYCKRICSG